MSDFKLTTTGKPSFSERIPSRGVVFVPVTSQVTLRDGIPVVHRPKSPTSQWIPLQAQSLGKPFFVSLVLDPGALIRILVTLPGNLAGNIRPCPAAYSWGLAFEEPPIAPGMGKATVTVCNRTSEPKILNLARLTFQIS